VKHRETVEAIVGAVTGDLRRPEFLVVGRYRGKELQVVGRTVKLKDDQAAVVEVAADAALQAGRYRHPLRLVRIRADMQPDDVPALPDCGADS
jgi:hypothetical protein